MVITFHNLTVSIEAENAKEAYKQLCEMLDGLNKDGSNKCEWTSDTYGFDDEEGAHYYDTDELFEG